MITNKLTLKEKKELIKIYKASFKEHNILKWPESDILKYFKNKYILIAKDKEVMGGLMIRNTEISKTHKTWKLNHLAVSKKHQRKGIATQLVKEAEAYIKKQSKTVKIEVSVAEEPTLKFWKKLKYKVEGKLKSHYRYNETTYILGKEL